MRKGKKQPEITAEWLLARVVDRGDGCLVWKGECCNGGKDPRARLGGKAVNVRRAAWEAFHGRQLRSDQIVRAACETPGCCEPAHLVAPSRTQVYRGKPKSLAHRAAIARTKREGSKVPQERIASIKESELSCREEAQLHGIHKDMVRRIRAGLSRREYSSPFAGLGA